MKKISTQQSSKHLKRHSFKLACSMQCKYVSKTEFHRGNKMKALLTTLFILSTLNIFAAEIGEDKQGECIFSDQTAKRESKIVIDSSQEKEKKEVPATISK